MPFKKFGGHFLFNVNHTDTLIYPQKSSVEATKVGSCS